MAAKNIFFFVVLSLMMVACGGGGEPRGGEQVDSRPPTDSEPSEFAVQVLADGVVTRDEMEQAYAATFECLREGGVEGEVLFDVDLTIGYASNFYVVEPGGDEAGWARLDEMDAHKEMCDATILYPLLWLYREQNPDTAAIVEERHARAMECLRESLPDLASEASEEWDLETLTIWAYEEAEARGVGHEAELCVNDFGLSWIDLEDA